jgi:hypothetical protein
MSLVSALATAIWDAGIEVLLHGNGVVTVYCDVSTSTRISLRTNSLQLYSNVPKNHVCPGLKTRKLSAVVIVLTVMRVGTSPVDAVMWIYRLARWLSLALTLIWLVA